MRTPDAASVTLAPSSIVCISNFHRLTKTPIEGEKDTCLLRFLRLFKSAIASDGGEDAISELLIYSMSLYLAKRQNLFKYLLIQGKFHVQHAILSINE